MTEHGTNCFCSSVGFHTLDLEYPGGDAEKKLTLGVWYPCRKASGMMSAVPNFGPYIVHDAEILPGRYPLFVFSHGFSDSAVQGGYLAKHLAAQGWIVAAADHDDPFTRWRIRQGRIRHVNRKGLRDAVQVIANCTPADRLNYMYRLDEMANALQGLLATEPFASAIIEDRIAVGGHSFGGFAALGLCGTIPERFDPRIKAAVLLSSNSSGLFYTPEERGAVCMPVMLFIGEQKKTISWDRAGWLIGLK
jgi:pimeloyl-ACP methyl ester carboxylesterase